MNVSDLTGKAVLVMGLGRFGGGVDVAQFAARAGAHVIVTDAATEDQLADSVAQLREFPKIELKLGGHDPDDFATADVVVANPAVRSDDRFLQIARRHQKVITSQIEWFFQRCPARIVGITGANGKSTTASLIAYLLERAGPSAGSPGNGKVWLSGNIGHRPLLGTLGEMGQRDVVVLELSSFQLEQLAEIGKGPALALVTNVTPNHLDRHGTFEAYCAAKENIFRFQSLDEKRPAVSIFNAEDPVAAAWFEKYDGQTGRTCVKYAAAEVPEPIRAGFPLPGRANLSNLAGALAVTRQFGVQDDAVAEVLPDFQGLPHRLEWVATIDGVRWYNDSIATTPQSVMVALEAFDEPKILIAGGYDKNLPFAELGREIATGAKAAILVGQTAPKLAEAIRAGSREAAQIPIVLAQSLAEAVQAARQHAIRGDVALLSPACASYDMFENFQQRGRQFAQLVRQLDTQL